MRPAALAVRQRPGRTCVTTRSGAGTESAAVVVSALRRNRSAGGGDACIGNRLVTSGSRVGIARNCPLGPVLSWIPGATARMTQDFRPGESSSELVDVIRQVRRRWRIKLALRGAAGCRCARRRAPVAVRVRAAVVAVHRRFDRGVPHAVRAGVRGARRLPARAAAAAAGHRRTGGAVPRGARAVAPGGDHQRGRSRAADPASRRTRRRWSRRLVESAVEKCRGDRRRPRRRARDRSAATAPRSPRSSSPRSRCSCSAPPTCVMRCRRCC